MTATLTKPAEGDELPPSLGGEVVDWMESHLVHGPGSRNGHEYVLTDEHKAFVWDAYELNRAGRRRWRRAVYSRRKGVAKTELSAAITAAEFLGPVRFDGWADKRKTEPVGRPVGDPSIPVAATTRGQADKTVFEALSTMLTEGPLADEVDVNLDKIVKVGRAPGSIFTVSANNVSQEGAKPTFTPADETHGWKSRELHLVHEVLLGALFKRPEDEPWMLETTTAYEPGHHSIAEGSADYARKVARGELLDPYLLFDHLQAADHWDLDTPEGLEAALREASGLFPALDLEGLVQLYHDPTYPKERFLRLWLNRPTLDRNQWVNPAQWDTLKVTGRVPKRGATIVLGFDGALVEDSTALIGVEVRTGHVFVVGLWEKDGDSWEVPKAEVDARVRWAFRQWNVVRMHCDPPYWEDEVSKWAADYGSVVVEWYTRREIPMAQAISATHTAIVTDALTHDGDARLATHVDNCRTRDTRNGKQLRKPIEGGPDKIDAAVAMVLAWQARLDAVAKGLTVNRKRGRGLYTTAK